jgi:hypothetical protein
MSCTLHPLKPDLLKIRTPASSSRSRTSWDDALAMAVDMTGHLRISRGGFGDGWTVSYLGGYSPHHGRIHRIFAVNALTGDRAFYRGFDSARDFGSEW